MKRIVALLLFCFLVPAFAQEAPDALVKNVTQEVVGLITKDKEIKSGNRAKLIRTENGKTHEIKVKLDNILNKGDLATNVALQPGDVLVVPESVF